MSGRSTRILRARDHAALAWKNGLGVSHVIASQPERSGHDNALWQVGTTSIESSCPFSDLPGLDRQFMVLEGEGVELHCRGPNGDPDVRHRINAPFLAFAFRGEWQTDCRLLDGPVRVFNVATRRGRYRARVSAPVLPGLIALEKAAGETLLVFVAEGSIRIEGCPDTVATNDAMIADESKPERYSISAASARIVVVHFNAVRPITGQ